jgi:hypothetical protein
MKIFSAFSFALLGVAGAFTADPSTSGRPATALQDTRRSSLLNIAFGLTLPQQAKLSLDSPRKDQVSLDMINFSSIK